MFSMKYIKFLQLMIVKRSYCSSLGVSQYINAQYKYSVGEASCSQQQDLHVSTILTASTTSLDPRSECYILLGYSVTHSHSDNFIYLTSISWVIHLVIGIEN